MAIKVKLFSDKNPDVLRDEINQFIDDTGLTESVTFCGATTVDNDGQVVYAKALFYDNGTIPGSSTYSTGAITIDDVSKLEIGDKFSHYQVEITGAATENLDLLRFKINQADVNETVQSIVDVLNSDDNWSDFFTATKNVNVAEIVSNHYGQEFNIDLVKELNDNAAATVAGLSGGAGGVNRVKIFNKDKFDQLEDEINSWAIANKIEYMVDARIDIRVDKDHGRRAYASVVYNGISVLGGSGAPYWLAPVANSAALPTGDPLGAIRIALDTANIYKSNGDGTWTDITEEARQFSWRDPVANPAGLPTTEPQGVIRLTLNDNHIWLSNGDTTWTDLFGTTTEEPSGADPVGPSEDGDRYYNTTLHTWMFYDDSRNKWLSESSQTFSFGRNGDTPAGAYYRGINGRTLSATIGYPALFDGTVVMFSYSRADTDDADFEISADGVPIATISSSAISGVVTTVDGDFNAGQILSVKNKTGGNTTSDVQGWVIMRWRA